MNEELKSIVDALVERFKAGVYEFKDEASLVIEPQQIVEVCEVLRDEYDFSLLVDGDHALADVVCWQWIPRQPHQANTGCVSQSRKLGDRHYYL